MYNIENEQGGEVRGRMLEKMGYSREGVRGRTTPPRALLVRAHDALVRNLSG